MPKERTSFTITIDVSPKGAYLSILDPTGGLSEYMILPPALTYLVPIINATLKAGILLSGSPLRISDE